jgi:hypothetical protein
MIRSTIILCASVIATCFACAPSPRVVTPSPRVVTTSVCDPTNPSSFGDFVQLLVAMTPPYDPSNLIAPPTNSITPLPKTDQRRSDLVNAFAAAPMTFRTALCRVDGIYIDANASTSWGFRTPTTLQRYIGLSASLWSPGPGATIFSDYETQRLQRASNSTLVSYKIDPSSGTDTSQETVLAALAHEYGHILWYDTFKSNGNYPGGATQFGPNDPTSCKFYHSWNAPLTGPGRFRQFAAIDLGSRGNVINEHATNASSDNVKLQDLNSDIHGATRSNLPRHLAKLYSTNGRWASLLSALSIDEDWIETFELLVLENSTPPLTGLQLVISGANSGNIPGDDHLHKKGELKKKEDCVSSLTHLP